MHAVLRWKTCMHVVICMERSPARMQINDAIIAGWGMPYMDLIRVLQLRTVVSKSLTAVQSLPEYDKLNIYPLQNFSEILAGRSLIKIGVLLITA
jgi:hypothetical protein